MAETNAAAAPSGQPPNMYANLLANYQTAAQNNYGQQINSANRNVQQMTGENYRQQQLLNRQNKFWNRMKNGFTSGLVNLAGQLPTMALKAGATALAGPAGGMIAGGAMGGGGGAGEAGATDLGSSPYAGQEMQTSLGATGAGVGGTGLPPVNPYAGYLAGGMYA